MSSGRLPQPITARRSEPLVIAHVSDLHLGANARVVDSLVADVAEAAPTVTVVTGDLTMRAHPRQFELAREVLDRLPRPRIVVIGNHDVPLTNPVRRIATPYRRYQSALTQELDPVLDSAGVRIQGLGSMPWWRWKSGRITRSQCRRVVATLAAAGPPGTRPAREAGCDQGIQHVAVVRVVALHHPVATPGAAGLVGRRRLIAALATARVDLVLSGHTHVPASHRMTLPVPGGRHHLVEVVAGTATSTRTRGVPRSWTLIRIDADGLHVQHRHQDGTGWRGAPTIWYPRTGGQAR